MYCMTELRNPNLELLRIHDFIYYPLVLEIIVESIYFSCTQSKINKISIFGSCTKITHRIVMQTNNHWLQANDY